MTADERDVLSKLEAYVNRVLNNVVCIGVFGGPPPAVPDQAWDYLQELVRQLEHAVEEAHQKGDRVRLEHHGLPTFAIAYEIVFEDELKVADDLNTLQRHLAWSAARERARRVWKVRYERAIRGY